MSSSGESPPFPGFPPEHFSPPRNGVLLLSGFPVRGVLRFRTGLSIVMRKSRRSRPKDRTGKNPAWTGSSMLTSDQLNSLLIVNESDRLKFTTATDYTDKFSQAVCAFVNDFSNSRKPGFLLIGVDGKGRPSGMKVTDKLLQNLGALRSDGNILPLPSMEVYSVGLEGGGISPWWKFIRPTSRQSVTRDRSGFGWVHEKRSPAIMRSVFSPKNVLPGSRALMSAPYGGLRWRICRCRFFTSTGNPLSTRTFLRGIIGR